MHIFALQIIFALPTDGGNNVSSTAGNPISNETDTNNDNGPPENPTSATEMPNDTSADNNGDVNNGSSIAWISASTHRTA